MLDEEDEERTRRTRRKATADTPPLPSYSFLLARLMAMAITDSGRNPRFPAFHARFSTVEKRLDRCESISSDSLNLSLPLSLEKEERFFSRTSRLRDNKRGGGGGWREKKTINEIPPPFHSGNEPRLQVTPSNSKPEKLGINSNGAIFYRDKAVIREEDIRYNLEAGREITVYFARVFVPTRDPLHHLQPPPYLLSSRHPSGRSHLRR